MFSEIRNAVADQFDDLNFIVDMAEKKLKWKFAEIIARNLVAWDTSDETVMPEVYFTNKLMYKELTGEDYVFALVVNKFDIE